MEEKDLVIIGAGPAGYNAAVRASQLGRKVTIIERDELGGTCLNWGCIPSKALLKSAEVLTEIKNASRFGITVPSVEADFAKIINRSRQVVGGLVRGVAALMKKYEIEVIKGSAKLAPDKTLKVTTEEGCKDITFNDVIIATGAKPRLFGDFQPNGETLHTSRTILACQNQPKELLVVGAGAIGVELAYFFSALGTKVTLVEMLDQILPLDDLEIAQEAQKIFTRRGMSIKTSSKVSNIVSQSGRVTATITTPKEEIAWQGDACLMATGVTPNTADLGCEEIGLKLDRNFIVVDNKLQTSLPHYYAIGDAARPPLLAHKAIHEGLTVAEVICGKDVSMKYDNIPACTYCKPQIASIGYTQQYLDKNQIAYKAAKLPFISNGKAQAYAETEGFIKLLSSPTTNEILGVHIIHAQASELIAEAVAVRAQKGTIEDIINTVHAHPTLSETLHDAALMTME